MTYASCASGSNVGNRPIPHSTTTKDDKYWLCRRSLRMWPVGGGDLRKCLAEFLKTRLKFDQTFLTLMGEVSIKRVIPLTRSKIKDEVTVIFSSIEI